VLHVQSVLEPLPAGDFAFDGQLMHVLAEIAPNSVEYVLTMHCKHSADSVFVLYLPAAHLTHELVTPSSSVKPEMHLQPDKDLLPASDWVFAGQASLLLFPPVQ